MISLFSIGIITSVSVVIGIIVFFVTNSFKKASYDKEKSYAILEEMRRSFENQMYQINSRLVQSEERWKDVNHLLLKEEPPLKTALVDNRRVPYTDFLKANGITENDLLIDQRLIFVLTPFNDLFFEEYNVIRTVCQNSGFKCIRGDEDYFKSDIFNEILKNIVAAKFIIANLDGRNANVFYELGIAHALDKPVLLISAQPGETPIDLRTKRMLVYTSLDNLSALLRKELMDVSVI